MRYACRENRIILTCAKDFGELVMKENLSPPAGIILFRLRPDNPAQFAEDIREILTTRTDGEGHFSVVDEKRIRMRPLCPSEKNPADAAPLPSRRPDRELFQKKGVETDCGDPSVFLQRWVFFRPSCRARPGPDYWGNGQSRLRGPYRGESR